jgi:hypothetical protein
LARELNIFGYIPEKGNFVAPAAPMRAGANF